MLRTKILPKTVRRVCHVRLEHGDYFLMSCERDDLNFFARSIGSVHGIASFPLQLASSCRFLLHLWNVLPFLQPSLSSVF